MSGDFTDGPMRQQVLDRYMARLQVGTGISICMEQHPCSKYDSPMKLERAVIPESLDVIVRPVSVPRAVFATAKETEAFKQGYALGFVLGALGYVRNLFGKAFKR
jgi:hypothetical protein